MLFTEIYLLLVDFTQINSPGNVLLKFTHSFMWLLLSCLDNWYLKLNISNTTKIAFANTRIFTSWSRLKTVINYANFQRQYKDGPFPISNVQHVLLHKLKCFYVLYAVKVFILLKRHQNQRCIYDFVKHLVKKFNS